MQPLPDSSIAEREAFFRSLSEEKKKGGIGKPESLGETDFSQGFDAITKYINNNE
jgi:hypothetical protein